MKTAYLDSKSLVFDSVAKCKTGKRCGKVCIPKKAKCKSENKQSQLKSPVHIAAGVGLGATLGTAALAAGFGALGAVKLKQIRDIYHKNFAVNAVKAAADAKSIKVPKLSHDKKGIVLAVGGFGTKDAFSESKVLEEHVNSLGIKGLHVDPQRYAEFNVPTRPVDSKTAKQSVKEAKNLFIKTVVKTGYNPVAVRVAATAMAYKNAHPDKEIHLIGHSGGGLVIQEAHEILHKAGIKSTSTAIGSPDVGIIPGHGNLVTATSDKDKILKLTNGKGVNGKSFNDVTDHAQDAYFASDDFRKFIKERHTPTSTRKDSDISQSRLDAIAKCKTGKRCGNVCIPQKSKCKSGVNSSSSSLAGVKKNKAIISALKSPEALTAVGTKLLAAAAVSGLPVGVAIAARERYRAGLPKSIEMAKEKAAKIDPASLQDFSNKKQITFFQSGFTDGAGKVRAAAYLKSADNLLKKEFPQDGIVSRRNEGFNIKPIVKDPDPKLSPNHPSFYNPQTPTYVAKFLAQAVSKTVGTFFKEGHNPEAVNLASEVYAYHTKYPSKPLNIIGHSAGGIIAPEAANILKGMGVKAPIKVVTIGSPDFGVIDYPETKSYASKNDPITKIFSNPKATYQNEVNSHHYADYLLHPQIRKEISQYFNSSSKTDSAMTLGAIAHKMNHWQKPTRADAQGQVISQATLQQIQRQFSILLSRSYGSPIRRVGNIKIALDNTVTGIAQDNTGKTLDFTFKNDELTYKLNNKPFAAHTNV